MLKYILFYTSILFAYPLMTNAQLTDTQINNMIKEAGNGNVLQQFALSLLYDEKNEHKKALTYLEKAAKNNYQPAQRMLAFWYYFGHKSININYKKALFWYEKLANQNDINAQIIVANIYRTGLIGKADFINAKKWYTVAALSGNSRAKYYLGFMNFRGLGSKKDLNNAIKWLQESANDNNNDAQYMLAKFYQNGIGVEQSNALYLKYMKLAAISHAKAQFELAQYYYPTDKVQSIQWLKKSHEQDYIPAKQRWKELGL